MAEFPEYKREFNYTNELKQNTAYMQLGKPIGFNEKSKEPTIIGASFADEMYFWNSMGKDVCVKINCPGGRMFDGWPIMDAVRTTDASIEVVGICASMAVSILLSARKEKRSAMSYAKVMIHGPHSNGGPVDKVQADMMRNSLETILKETTNFKATQISEMLAEGAPDTWLTAKDMKKYGLVSSITPTNSSEEVEETDPYAMYKVFNQLNEQEMAEPAKPAPGADVTQAFLDIHNQLAASKAETAAKDAALLEMQNKLKALEDQAKADKLTAATALVDVAIKNKQISLPADPTAAMALRNQFVEMANTAPDAFKVMLGTAKPAAASTERQSVLQVINLDNMNGAGAPKEETYEYLANHNPQKLYAMMDENPEQYNKLVKDFQQVKNRII